MHGLTDYITACDWSEIFLVWLVLVDDTYQQLYADVRLRQRGPAPQFTDAEVITLSLIADTYFHGCEELMHAFVRQHYRREFPHLLSRSRFNRRRRMLGGVLEEIRQVLAQALIAPTDAVRLIDSAPIPVCTYQRSSHCTTVQGKAYCGVMTSRKAKVFGFRIVLTTTLDQVVDQWLLAPTGPHDSKTAEAVLEDAANLLVLGDNAYCAPLLQQRLAENRHIRLLAPPQRKQIRGQWSAALRQFSNRLRRRIESALSVLTGVFHLEQVGSRSLAGLVARVATRLLAYTLSFFAKAILMPNSN
jgi:hypothetical protein